MALRTIKLGTTPTELYTSIGTNALVVGYFCNTDANAVMVNVHAVGAGDTASADNLIYNRINITSLDTYVIDSEKLILDNGESLWASATTPDVVIATANTIGV
jgi:hypothetical protein